MRCPAPLNAGVVRHRIHIHALMISHDNFGALRLAQFLPDARIAPLSDLEFADRLWVGEAIGFSEWLRLEDDPEILRSLAIDFSELPHAAAEAMLKAIDLPVSRGMTLEELRRILGTPDEVLSFTPDRLTYEFLYTGPPAYKISCTVLNDGGLTYLVVMVPSRASDV